MVDNDDNDWLSKIKLKTGALSKQLGIPEDKNIPMDLLLKIKDTEYGFVVKNKHGIGKKYIKVTTLLKKRAILAINLKKLGEKNKKRGGEK